MAILLDVNDEGDVACSSCGIIFALQWRRQPGVGVCFCPFCGDELEDETSEEAQQ